MKKGSTKSQHILNGERIDLFLLRVHKDFYFLFNTVLGVLFGANKTRKLNKSHSHWKGRSNIVSICGWHDLIHNNSKRNYKNS